MTPKYALTVSIPLTAKQIEKIKAMAKAAGCSCKEELVTRMILDMLKEEV